MQQQAIKCPYNKYIMLPEGVAISVGDCCICPKTCNEYKSRRVGCLRGVFDAKIDSDFMQGQDVEIVEYSPEEVTKNFPKLVATTKDSATKPQVRETQTQSVHQNSEQKQESIGGKASGAYTFGGYSMPLYSASQDIEKKSAEREVAPQKEINVSLAPRGQYKWFELRGEFYALNSNDYRLNLNNQVCIDDLFYKILATFDVNAVFEGNDVKDEFLWVLDKTLRGEKRERAVSVLQDRTLGRVNKFFSLFYCAIFFDRIPPLPLYWANGYTDDLQPIYKDKSDFYRKIADSSGEGACFYYQNADVVLLWLRKIEFSELNDQEKKEQAIIKIQNEVAEDPNSDSIVFCSQARHCKFVCLGSKTDFIERFTVSDKSLEELEDTAEFLARYDLEYRRGQYVVVKRNVEAFNDLDILPNECNSDVLAKLFSKHISMDKLKAYLYIVKRFCKTFHPKTVTIGALTFDEGRYTEQIEEIVLKACCYLCGEATEDKQKRDALNDALLVKMLYNHSIIFEDAIAARDREYMSSLLWLIDLDVNSSNFVKEYFSVCKRKGIADKIKLYSYDYSVQPRVAREFALDKWLCMTVRNVAGASELIELIGSKIFEAYKDVFGLDRKKDADEIFAYYQGEERRITEILNKL